MSRLRALSPMVLSLVLAAAPALAQSSGFGRAQDTKLPVEVTAEQLSVDQKTGKATFSGKVLIGQGQMRLSADRVTVTYAQGNQSRISALENGIADRRELYNEAVNLLNVRIEQFPDLIVARLFAFIGQPLLQFSTAEKADVDLKALFSA